MEQSYTSKEDLALGLESCFLEWMCDESIMNCLDGLEINKMLKCSEINNAIELIRLSKARPNLQVAIYEFVKSKPWLRYLLKDNALARANMTTGRSHIVIPEGEDPTVNKTYKSPVALINAICDHRLDLLWDEDVSRAMSGWVFIEVFYGDAYEGAERLLRQMKAEDAAPLRVAVYHLLRRQRTAGQFLKDPQQKVADLPRNKTNSEINSPMHNCTELSEAEQEDRMRRINEKLGHLSIPELAV